MQRYGRAAARSLASFHPVMAAVREKTLTMAVPSDGTEARRRPAMWSAARRPWRLATFASATRDEPPLTESDFSTASPTA